MQVSGFTFIKNGLTLGYPILESVLSISPLCDEVIINVGFDDPLLKNDDGTYEYLRDHLTDKKYIFLKSYWNPALKKDGLILSEQTNIALARCQGKYCQYIQGDECVHEEDLSFILEDLKKLEENSEAQGLLFNYLHFYGNVDTYKYTRNLYRREVRLIKNNNGIKSWKDAQGFRDVDNKKIYVLRTKARIFHYGWARQEQVMDKKVKSFDTLYHGDKELDTNYQFKYIRNWGVKKFMLTHPHVMSEWIIKNRNPIDLMSLPLTLSSDVVGLAISDGIEVLTDYRIGEYKNYRLCKS